MEDLLPISIPAYTLSLALSITYRQLKNAQLLTARILAIENLTLFHQCLVSLSDTWWLAAMMQRLGKHALESVQATSDPSGLAQNIIRQTPSVISLPSDAAIATPSSAPRYNITTSENLPADTDAPEAFPGHDTSGEIFASDLDHLFENFDFTSVEEGYFDTFFQNFLDVNLPSTLSEQIVCDQDSLL